MELPADLRFMRPFGRGRIQKINAALPKAFLPTIFRHSPELDHPAALDRFSHCSCLTSLCNRACDKIFRFYIYICIYMEILDCLSSMYCAFEGCNNRLLVPRKNFLWYLIIFNERVVEDLINVTRKGVDRMFSFVTKKKKRKLFPTL